MKPLPQARGKAQVAAAPSGRVRVHKRVPAAMKFLRNVVLLFIGLYFLLPLLWLVTAPFSNTPTFQLRWPDWTLANFPRLMEARGALGAFGNSIILAGTTMIAVAILATLAAYALSRYPFPWRDVMLYVLVLFSSVVQGVAAIVPLYTLTLRLGLLDTHVGVILVLSGGLLPTALFIIKDFVDGLPRSYEEASLVDGATPLQTFTNIALPLISGGTVVIAVLTFVGAWGNFLIPFILMRSQEKYPAAIAIYSFFNELGMPFVNLVAAYALLYTVPVIVLYLVIQRVFGFQLHGGLKG
ncbi:MAG TPA: carbohydrate ABC transporter permease [Deinococcales bacterium]|nr:carbohydrate ABC transporter permease [Deinococcales bacterium]